MKFICSSILSIFNIIAQLLLSEQNLTNWCIFQRMQVDALACAGSTFVLLRRVRIFAQSENFYSAQIVYTSNISFAKHINRVPVISSLKALVLNDDLLIPLEG